MVRPFYANAPIGFDGQSTPTRARTPLPVLLPAGYGRQLDIHFTVNAFVDAERFRFKYRLEGVDSDWVNVGSRRSAYYRKLPPGSYNFRVMAGDEYQDWTESTISLPIHLTARIYENRWFRNGVAAALLFFIIGIARWRWRESRKLRALDRQAALTQERIRLARDLHDQLGAELTRAARLAEQLEEVDIRQAPPENLRLRESLSAMRQQIDATVWAVSPDKDRLGSVVDFTTDRAQALLEGTGVELELLLPEAGLDVPLPSDYRHQLAMAVLEAVNNALRHARATLIRLTFQLGDKELQIEIIDNGCGFQPPQRAARNGLATMQARVTHLGGELKIESHAGTGTRVIIRMPLPSCNTLSSLSR